MSVLWAKPPTRSSVSCQWLRVDPAPGFRALIDDPMLRKYRIQVEVGWIKNPNHKPVAEKAIQELESELV